MRYFHFTLGPVQGFVAQARRTRDFWAGSFLLSYLAGVAMREVIEQKGNIVFPQPDKSYLRWIDGTLRQGTAPKHGAIPNRFMAEVSDEFQASKVEKAVKTAWRELAERVWNEDLKDLGNTGTRTIWDRQINRFWDISWVLTRDEKATDLLDRRKNWRSHYLRPEPGMKCMAMEGMQELSSSERPGEGGDFWKQLRESGKRRIATDLREKERLCAIAYVKRRFVHYFKGFTADMPSGWKAHGWYLPPNVDSVVYLAARPWLDSVQELAKECPEIEGKLRDFYSAARVLSGENETETEKYDWPSIEELAFFEADLRANPQLFTKPGHADKTVMELTTLQKAAGFGPPSPYYALLLMDGDSLGQHMSDPAKRGLISTALNAFTGEVQKIVEQDHSGFLIYAGGDDVLALLTLDDALPCAEALRNHYEAAFRQAKAAKPAVEDFLTTISAAIEYAHYRLPFTKVLADAHDLLDNFAKERRGRDAVAARVWKQSGLHLTWAQPWKIALEAGGIGGLVEKLRGKDGEKTQVAGGFFYRMRELFDLLNPPKQGQPETRIEKDGMLKLLAYEYAHSGIHGNRMALKDAEAFIRPLLEQCQPMFREAKEPQKVCFKSAEPVRYEADAALLVRFLANRGNERH
jgi:CRISPR-associated protein Cmr2